MGQRYVKYDCTIDDSYADCKITCTDLLDGIGGGLVSGSYPVVINNSYSACRIFASNKLGIGPDVTNANAINTYFDEERAEIATPATHSRKTSAMYKQMNYTAWDFADLWTIEEGVSYPKLQSAINIIEPEEPDKIKLDIYLEVNEDLQLSLNDSLSRNGDLTWKSSDPSIVTVSSSGVIKALKKGDVVITVKATDSTYTESVTVFVVGDSEELRLAADINMGKSFRVKIRGVSNPSSVVYMSADTSTAIVNTEGRVTGVSSGLALITAKDNQGNELNHIYVRVR